MITIHENQLIYSIMVVVAFLVGTGTVCLMNYKRGVPGAAITVLAIISILLGVCFGFIFELLTTKELKGISSLGGLIGIYFSVFLTAWYTKTQIFRRIMFENCTLVLPLMYAVSKIGCLFAGCCRGFHYHGKFCIQYINILNETAEPVFPAQILESLMFFIIFVIGILVFQKQPDKTPFAIYMISALSKLWMGFLRLTYETQGLTASQLMCGMMIVTGCIWYLFETEKQEIDEMARISKKDNS